MDHMKAPDLTPEFVACAYYTQGNSQILLNDDSLEILIISEETDKPSEWMSKTKYKDRNFVRTFYKNDNVPKDDRSFNWDWTKTEFPSPRQFDLVIARSMICPCEEDHFNEDRSRVKNTCGGITPDDRLDVLFRVGNLLKNKSSIAYLTNSTTERGFQHYANRGYGYNYWQEKKRKFEEDGRFSLIFIHEPDQSAQEVKPRNLGGLFSEIKSRRREDDQEEISKEELPARKIKETEKLFFGLAIIRNN